MRTRGRMDGGSRINPAGWTFVSTGDPRAPTTAPAPPPTLNPTPVPPPSIGERQMVGGCIGHEEWSSGRIAIDFAANRLWVVGHDQTLKVYEYRLSDCTGTGG